MKNVLAYLSVIFFITVLQLEELHAQNSPGCLPLISQKDTIICPGDQLVLKLLPPPVKDSMLPGVWKQLIKGAAMDSTLFNLRPYGFDKLKQIVYSIIHNRIVKYNLVTNTVSSVTATNWPGDYTEFTYDFSNKRLLLWRAGKDSVYAIPETGGAWVGVGGGGIDRSAYGASPYWNPINQQVGFYGGFGFNEMKSWIYENNGGGWAQRKNNPLIDSTPAKGGNLMGANADGTKLFLFSGQGSYSGNELTNACDLGSPWATANGTLCWLKDLWELDLATYQFNRILPVNDSTIQYEGALSYHYDKNRFYLFGGYQPTADFNANLRLPNTQKTFLFRRGVDAGFKEFQGEGEVPPVLPTNNLRNYSYYDPIGKRIIWARFDGIWAYYPDSSLVPADFKSVLWSNGDTSSIETTIKPLVSTAFYVTRTLGSQVCRDTVQINVTNMLSNIQRNVKHCGDSVQLNAGPGFEKYLWSNGDTSMTTFAKMDGMYQVALTKDGCYQLDTSFVQFAKPVIPFTIALLKDTVCVGETDSAFILSPQAGITYAWSANNSRSVNGNNFIIKNINTPINLIATGSTVGNICASASVNITIPVRLKLPKPNAVFDTVTATSVSFKWDSLVAATGYLISKDRGRSIQFPTAGALANRQTYEGLLPNQVVTVWVKATGRFDCENSDSVQIITKTLNPFGNGIYIPNTFTPNGDGVNDIFNVHGTAIDKIRLIIFNQWGAKVFETTEKLLGWNGDYKNKPSPTGSYSYLLEAIMENGALVKRGGSFQLIR